LSFYADSTDGAFWLLPTIGYWSGKRQASIVLVWLWWEAGVEWTK
jgi:hypothetical protein